MSRLFPVLMLLVSALLANGATPDQPGKSAANRVRWENMSEQQRAVLRKAAAGVSTQELARLRRRLAEFKALPKEEQARIKRNYRKYLNLNKKERAKLRERFNHFKILPKSIKQRIRRKNAEKKAKRRKAKRDKKRSVGESRKK